MISAALTLGQPGGGSTGGGSTGGGGISDSILVGGGAGGLSIQLAGDAFADSSTPSSSDGTVSGTNVNLGVSAFAGGLPGGAQLIVLDVTASVGGVERESDADVAGAAATTSIRFTSTHFAHNENITVYGRATFEDTSTNVQFSSQVSLTVRVHNAYFGWYIVETGWTGLDDYEVVKDIFTSSGFAFLDGGQLEFDEILDAFLPGTAWSGHTHGTETQIASAEIEFINNIPYWRYVSVSGAGTDNIAYAVGSRDHVTPPYHLAIVYACETVSVGFFENTSAYFVATQGKETAGAHAGFENEVALCTADPDYPDGLLLSNHAEVLRQGLLDGLSLGQAVTLANTEYFCYQEAILINGEWYLVPSLMQVVGDPLTTTKWVYLSTAERAELSQNSVTPDKWYYWNGVIY
ncbi:MAG: hypothetical protein KF812_08210 [Fimbriimonadaceae bacterium]|nr:hypothetical protein [Fimbriimonadaceae bacterium]